MQLGGLGPKRVRALHEELAIDSLDGLKEAVEAGRVHAVSGFGKKTEEGIKARLANWQGQEARTPLVEAEEVVKILVRYLAAGPGVEDVAPAGSFRRRLETVGDLDLLVACEDPVAIMDRFVGYEEVCEVVSKGETRSTVRLRSGMQVDLRVVPKASWGAALHYFTGSKAHNIAVRRRGVERGLKINEYGVFRGEDQIAGETEEAVYDSVGLAFIATELREDRGGVAAAESGTLPRLVSLEDIRGDLHVHTKVSDGHDGLEAMAEAAAERGYEYLAITDHTKHLGVARGLDAERLAERGCCLEVNAQPSRLDLTDVACKMAKEAGVKVAISTDAHGRDGLNNMRFGVWQARRGWLGQADVINTRSLGELGRLLERA